MQSRAERLYRLVAQCLSQASLAPSGEGRGNKGCGQSLSAGARQTGCRRSVVRESVTNFRLRTAAGFRIQNRRP